MKKIDLSKMSLSELNELEAEIKNHKDNVALVTYRVTLDVTFHPGRHLEDCLTEDGAIETSAFSDYIEDVIVDGIETEFNLTGGEGAELVGVSRMR